ncbi:conserved hypothetical protein [Ricinus communis]|uniref:Uncharacterized protein n=1 Tax=Ricinus communis TaxID=3988 RepID=B9SA75_RICCO|nr:conserved hypothetical protein [Ricinus communis]
MANVNDHLTTYKFDDASLNVTEGEKEKDSSSLRFSSGREISTPSLTLQRICGNLIIRGNRMEGRIIGTRKCPLEFVTLVNDEEETIADNPKYEDWAIHDQILIGWLYNSIEPDVASKIMEYETSKDLLESIRDLFGVKSK